MAGNRIKKTETEIKVRPTRKAVSRATPATVLKIQDAAKLLAKGKSRATVIEYLMDKYGLAPSTATDYYEDAIRFLLPENESKLKENLIKVNATRLETIYERAMDEGDLKAATEAIAQLNKMLGVGREGVSIGINTDKDSDTQQVFIHFDK